MKDDSRDSSIFFSSRRHTEFLFHLRFFCHCFIFSLCFRVTTVSFFGTSVKKNTRCLVFEAIHNHLMRVVSLSCPSDPTYLILRARYRRKPISYLKALGKPSCLTYFAGGVFFN